MEIPITAATFSVGALLITNLVVVVKAYQRLRDRIDTVSDNQLQSAIDRKEALLICNRMHDEHYMHEHDPEKHIRGMSKEMILLHFEQMNAAVKGVSEAIRVHSEADMLIFREINGNLKEIRGMTERRRQE